MSEFIVEEGVPDIRVLTDEEGFITEIKTVTYLRENRSTVVLDCVEWVEEFKRGFVCTLVTQTELINGKHQSRGGNVDTIKDLVLVYINKTYNSDGFPEYRYIFYK